MFRHKRFIRHGGVACTSHSRINIFLAVNKQKADKKVVSISNVLILESCHSKRSILLSFLQLSVAGELLGELVAPVLGLKQLETDGIEFSLTFVFGWLCELS